MQCRYADFSDVPRLAEARARRRGEKVDEKALNDWLSGECRVVILEDDANAEVGVAVYRATAGAIELLELSADGDLGEAIQAMRDELWPSTARVRVQVPAEATDLLGLWRKLGFRDVRVVLEASDA